LIAKPVTTYYKKYFFPATMAIALIALHEASLCDLFILAHCGSVSRVLGGMVGLGNAYDCHLRRSSTYV
jgi:hypothetical protein